MATYDQSMLEVLAGRADQVRQLKEDYDVALRERNELCQLLYGRGVPQVLLAQAMGLKAPQVLRITSQ